MVVLALSSGLLLSTVYFNTSACVSAVECSSIDIYETYQQAESDPLPVIAEWKATEQPQDSFWDNWARELDSPFLTSNISSSFYGLGVWIPEKFAGDDFLDVEDVSELIKKYGLQMSFGFGGENGQSPRLRFDYRWHEDRNLEDVFIQVEIPFQ
ncbi:hypothetical protein ACQKPX_13720 [Photobacterium sp. DNB23_23_1]